MSGSHTLTPPHLEVPEPPQAMPGVCSARAQQRRAPGSCLLASKTPRLRDLLRASRAEAQVSRVAHADKHPSPAGIQIPKYACETPQTGGGQTSPRQEEKPFLRNTESYVYLAHYLTVASFIDFEKSQKFFLLFICLIVAK